MQSVTKEASVSKSPESKPFRRTRRDHASEIAEDYVEAIAEIIDASGACRVRDLSERFGVTHVTVVRAIQRLERDGLVVTEPYRPVELTPQGQRLAAECKRRHDIVFVGIVGCPADLTGDGVLDFFDVSAFLAAYSSMDPAADFTGDGIFNFFDVSAFLGEYSAGCP